ncbi:aldo/keto reductase [Bacillus sp. Au-Bac7]|uniref:aldo/keto reductase n=1 Tax=Bacillus sp. Au-Bac7 TaxID=2906458 RepID=UPI001E381F9D|nr:aldo/keto reductase [Bacillus sp. Au-Bac7]MCE4051113.1 aldo/keto reductase [Bacillus sp. Au-Bac7]
MNIHHNLKLHNGIEMPLIGLGTYNLGGGRPTVETVKAALDLGFRSIDTASFYNNELEVGEGIKESAVFRKDVFVTTKLWNDEQGYDAALRAFEASLRRLDMDYVDLYLIHWPGKDKYIETWKAFERLYGEGVVKAIGVSNFQEHHLSKLLSTCNEKPAVNQIELHPRLTQEKLREYCKKLNIKVEAWSPLANGRLLNEPTINYIAKKHGRTPAQIILRWHVQNDIIVIPKTSSIKRLAENGNIFDFRLSMEEMNLIDSLNMNERIGQDPDKMIF